MQSLTSAPSVESERQAEIRRKIAFLEAQLNGNTTSLSQPEEEIDESILAPATPSPKKRKTSHEQESKPMPALITKISTQPKSQILSQITKSNVLPTSASSVISQLRIISKQIKEDKESIVRSSAFSERPPERKDEMVLHVPERDDNLALVEELELGPAEHKAPFDDPNFEKLEPNSGIHLTSRKLPHEDFQDYLRGRYYLSPSKLYSVVRLLPNKQGYDVPVEGDWVTIAVVAERGPIKVTSSPGSTSNNGANEDSDDEDAAASSKSKSKTTNDNKAKRNRQQKGKPKEAYQKKTSGRKYMNIKLVDFGDRSRSSSNSKSTLKGEALLSLLLFESDSFDVLKEADGNTRKIHKGGSGGAFEQFAKLREGMVIALLNPRILRPFQQSTNTIPHPVTNILALTPESAESIVIIGQSRDLGMCGAIKRDGKICGGWCDKRVSDACEYHVQTAVQSRRAARAEFSIGTSGMSAGPAKKRKAAYDPQRQWGLKPDTNAPGSSGSGGTDATYVLSGQLISSRGPDYVHESVGRESQSRAKRQQEQKQSEKLLSQLLSTDRDPDGAAAVLKKARMAVKNATALKGKNRRKEKDLAKDSDESDCSSAEESDTISDESKKRSYPVEIIKRLGFDPAARLGQKSLEGKKKQGPLKPRHSSIQLGPPPGQRLKSNIKAPKVRLDAVQSVNSSDTLRFRDSAVPAILDDEDDLYIEDYLGSSMTLSLSVNEQSSVEGGMNYDNDSDLEIEPPS